MDVVTGPLLVSADEMAVVALGVTVGLNTGAAVPLLFAGVGLGYTVVVGSSVGAAGTWVPMGSS